MIEKMQSARVTNLTTTHIHNCICKDCLERSVHLSKANLRISMLSQTSAFFNGRLIRSLKSPILLGLWSLEAKSLIVVDKSSFPLLSNLYSQFASISLDDYKQRLSCLSHLFICQQLFVSSHPLFCPPWITLRPHKLEWYLFSLINSLFTMFVVYIIQYAWSTATLMFLKWAQFNRKYSKQ